MNRSYSKLRHIQEMNKKLDNRIVEEKTSNQLIETFEVKSEKSKLIEILEKQRLLEENLKYHKNINFRYINEEETDPSTEVEDDDEIGDTPESAEDYEFLQSEFPNEWKEFEKMLITKILNSPEANEGGETETLTESQVKGLILEYGCNLQTTGLAKCIRNSKFGKWWRKKIGKPTKKAFNDFGWWVHDTWKDWMRDIKYIDLDIEFKKRKKKYKAKKSKSSGKKLKSLEKVWVKNKRGTIKIGRSGWLTFGKGKGSSYEEFDSEESMEPSIPEEEYETYLKDNEKTMVSLMTNTSRRNWETLKSDPDDVAYAVAVLERFNDTYEDKQWKKVGVGLDVNTFKSEIKQDPIINDIEGEEIVYPFQTFDFPFDMSSEPNLFVDNEWKEEYANVFTQQVGTLVNQVSEVLKNLNPPAGKPKGYIKALYLESSASRFRNGGNAADLTFLELSNKRLETAKKIITDKLNAIGVGFDSSTTFDFKPQGTNGDGTSGPNPPNGFGYIEKGEYKMSPNCVPQVNTCLLNGRNVKRNECGEPHLSKKDYDQYKYIRGTIVIVFNDTVKKLPDVTPPDTDKKDLEPFVEYIETDSYPIYFFSPGKKPFRIPLPGIRVKWDKLFQKSYVRKGKPTYGPPNKKPGETKCEFFGDNG